ncbi:MAG: class II fructose-bisphosphate aldolase [Planctomycetota bacterium]|jgi:fructose-bisphosphate aldolase class II/tagatose 1,6-diphosphate aldolase GatY/KbaY
MGLVSMKPILVDALKKKYAVGAFNMVDYNSALAVVRAAEEIRAPVIVQTSVKTVRFWGHATIRSWMEDIAGGSPVPVALHLDHCKEVDFCKQCVDAGWTSVMIDASAQPFEENLRMTREVFEAAEAADVSVEAELGEIRGVEEDKVVADEDAHLADPEKAVAFCGEVDLAAFAPAIGTAHGVYKGEPKLAFDRLDEIARRTGVPIALHGGTGLSDDVFRKCISLGCAKVNISTQLKYAFIDGFIEYHREHEQYEPLKVIGGQFERIKKEMADNMRLFDSAGRAAGEG